MQVTADSVIRLLKQKGPLVPNDIKKELKGDTLLFGAMLSELKGRGQVRLTNVKKGSSPFYYLPGQEPMLERNIELLNPKDQDTVRLLKERKVLQDNGLELIRRVSLRQIKDYAKEFTITTKEGSYLFWRYYLISEEEATNILRERLSPKKKEETQEQPKPEEPKQETQEQQKEPEPKQEAETKKPVEVEKREQPEPPEPAHKPKPIEKPKRKEEDQKTLSETVKEEIGKLNSTPFYHKVLEFFKQESISVEEEREEKKGKEYEFVVRVPSAVGQMKMFCRAKEKKKMNEGDVAPALLKAKQKDLPLLFLARGEFTKKSRALMKKEYSGLIIKEI